MYKNMHPKDNKLKKYLNLKCIKNKKRKNILG